MSNFCAYSLKWFFHCLNTNNLIPWTLDQLLICWYFFKVISYNILNYISWIFHLFEQVLLTWHLELHIILTLKQEHLFVTPPQNRKGVIFLLQFVCVCVSVCLCVRHFLWTKFQPNGCIDLDAVFAKWLLTALAQILLNSVTLGQRSRLQWRNIRFSSQFSVNFPTFYLSSLMSDQNEIWKSLRYALCIFAFEFH